MKNSDKDLIRRKIIKSFSENVIKDFLSVINTFSEETEKSVKSNNKVKRKIKYFTWK